MWVWDIFGRQPLMIVAAFAFFFWSEAAPGGRISVSLSVPKSHRN
jgi:hypothetical protein